MKVKLSKYIVISDSLDANNNIKSERIVFSTRTGKGIKITNFVIEMINQGQFTSIPDRLFSILMYHEIIVPEDENEMEMIVNRKLFTANDILKRQISILIRSGNNSDSSHLDEELQTMISVVNDKSKNESYNISHLNALILIEAFEQGFNNFEVVKRFLSSDEKMKAINVFYELLITNNKINSLPEFLPLSNPAFNKIIFSYNYFSSGGGTETLQSYLNSLLNIIERSSYLKDFPIDCYFFLNGQFLKNSSDQISAFRKLNLSSKAKLFFQIQKEDSEYDKEFLKQNELIFLTMLGQHNIKANFLPYSEITCHVKDIPIKKFGDSVIDISDNRSPVSALSPEDISSFSTFLSHNEKKIFYNSGFAQNISNNKGQCQSCIYLPMCGGRLGKKNNTDADCPVFIRNFMKKVAYMYNFPL